MMRGILGSADGGELYWIGMPCDTERFRAVVQAGSRSEKVMTRESSRAEKWRVSLMDKMLWMEKKRRTTPRIYLVIILKA